MLLNRKITSVILDWSGTTLDGLVRAPALTVIGAFKKSGVDITMKEARLPMGLPKDRHICGILQIPSVAQKWKAVHGRQPDLVKDTQKVFKDFLPMQLEILSQKEFIKPLPGVMKTLKELKSMGIKIGLTTGFNTEMTQVILDNSKDIKLESHFDAIVSCDHPNIKRGRPYPDGVWENMQQMGTEHTYECMKVDDTQAGIMEGNSAGVWTAGLWKYNNYVGTHVDTMEELAALEAKKCKKEYQKLMEDSKKHLLEKQPSFVCETLVDLPAIIKKLNHDMNDYWHKK